MDEYPNSDEEFELMYGDELELLREQESDLQEAQPTKQARTEAPTQIVTEQSSQSVNADVECEVVESLSLPASGSKKRTIEELFGEIDDILSEEIVDGKVKKRKCNDNESDLALIEHIIELRKLAKSNRNPISLLREHKTTNRQLDRNNLSYQVPRHSFVVVTKNDGKRLYIRCHSEKYESEERMRLASKGSFVGVMGEAFKQIWAEANKLINTDLNEKVNAKSRDVTNVSILKEATEKNTDLWVDLYKPKKYLELLSDESTNRTLLRWLKLWDKIVFNRRPKPKVIKVVEQNFNKFKKELNVNLDENGCPEQKVVLLCGPPGLGKTTLAHMVAKHAGYNVVEVNASDDRSIEKFKTVLESATQMRSVVDRENRPNCLVFDEIDGAPSSSIDFLIKFINGVVIKKKKGKQKPNILKRPIICICNDIYVPSLKPLRQIAFVLNFPPTASARLADRLNEIARHQKIKTDLGALLALCEKSGNDIRSCLSVLHFFKSLNKSITLSQVYKASVGQKDMQKGLFAVWQDIFQIQPVKINLNGEEKDKIQDTPLKRRMKKILEVVNAFGDYDRLAQGVFENYICTQIKDRSLTSTCEALDWFCFNDALNRKIYSQQNYTLLSYLPYAFVIWHYVFASSSWRKIIYPNSNYEAKLKSTRNAALLTEVMRGMQPSVRAFSCSSALLLDVVPLLPNIIIPTLRPVNLHLYSEEEKHQLMHAVAVMIDYNLNYIQERTPEGTYSFNIDPNINDIIQFSNSKPKHVLSYPNKQLIAREIEVEKMRRIEAQKHSTCSNKQGEGASSKKKDLPNHLQKLNVKNIQPKSKSLVTKDFFGRVVTKPNAASLIDDNSRHDIWYQYKEGYSNAVRKRIKIADLK